MRRLIAITLSLCLLAACATAPAPSVGRIGPEIAYLCDDLTTVFITAHPGDDARAVLNSGLELRLPQYPSTIGFTYSSATHEFRGGGSTAIWTVPQRPPVVCRQKP